MTVVADIVTAQAERIQELLEANNRYLENAREEKRLREEMFTALENSLNDRKLIAKKLVECERRLKPSTPKSNRDWRLQAAAATARAERLEAALRQARETLIVLKNARGSEAEGSDADWVGFIDAALADSAPTPAQPLKPDILCEASGDHCHGCAHYRGEAPVCEYAPTPAPDAGYVLVPREPTEAMIDAGVYASERQSVSRIYRAMIEASQQGGDNE